MPIRLVSRFGEGVVGTSKGDGSDNLKAVYETGAPCRLRMCVVTALAVGSAQPGGGGSGGFSFRVVIRVVDEENNSGVILTNTSAGPADQNKVGGIVAFTGRLWSVSESPFKIPLGLDVPGSKRVVVEVTGGNDGGAGAAVDVDASILLLADGNAQSYGMPQQ